LLFLFLLEKKILTKHDTRPYICIKAIKHQRKWRKKRKKGRGENKQKEEKEIRSNNDLGFPTQIIRLSSDGEK